VKSSEDLYIKPSSKFVLSLFDIPLINYEIEELKFLNKLFKEELIQPKLRATSPNMSS